MQKLKAIILRVKRTLTPPGNRVPLDESLGTPMDPEHIPSLGTAAHHNGGAPH